MGHGAPRRELGQQVSLSKHAVSVEGEVDVDDEELEAQEGVDARDVLIFVSLFCCAIEGPLLREDVVWEGHPSSQTCGRAKVERALS